jgi:hypothetical protein
VLSDDPPVPGKTIENHRFDRTNPANNSGSRGDGQLK